MLTLDEIKLPLQQRHGQLTKLLIALASLPSGVSLKQIRARALDAGFRIPSSWNCSDILRRSKGAAIRTPAGWEMTEQGWELLAAVSLKKSAQKLSVQRLQIAATQASDPILRAYLDEAIGCANAGFQNAAIVLSWMAAISVLQTHVIKNGLQEFNASALAFNPKWKNAKNSEQLGAMKERDFLDRLENIGTISNSVKKALIECLDRRNVCGHPTNVVLSPATVEHHFDLLIKNAIDPFGV